MKTGKQQVPSSANTQVAGATEPKLSGGEQRALRKAMSSAERKIDTLKGKIADVHVQMTQVDPSDYVKLGDLQKEIKEYEAQIEAHEEEWMEAAEALGE